METMILKLIEKMTPESLMLLVVLYGIWRIANRFLIIFRQNGEALVKEVKGIQEAMSVHVRRIDEHEFRLGNLEKEK